MAIPQDDVERVLAKAREVLAAEARTIAAMEAGQWDRSFIDALEAR